MLKFSITPRSQSHRQKWNSVQILIFVSFITRNKFLGFSIACFSLFIKQTDSTKPKECQVTEAMESTCHLARESKLLLLLIIAHGNHPGVDSGRRLYWGWKRPWRSAGPAAADARRHFRRDVPETPLGNAARTAHLSYTKLNTLWLYFWNIGSVTYFYPMPVSPPQCGTPQPPPAFY